MATLTYPSGIDFLPESFAMWLEPNMLASTAPLTKSVRRVRLTGSPWRMRMAFDRATPEGQAEREAFWNAVGGQENLIALYHFRRPVPRGTMRGTPTLAAVAAKGATSISIQTTAGATLLAGDMLGIGALVQVKAPATANGSGLMTVTIQPKLIAQIASGTAVVWNKPTADFMALSTGHPVGHTANYGEPFDVDLIQA